MVPESQPYLNFGCFFFFIISESEKQYPKPLPDFCYLNTSLKIPHDNIKFEKSQRVTLTQWPLKEERPLNKSITFINFVKMIWSKTPQCPLHIILLGSHPFDCGLMAKLWGLDFCWISLQIPIPGNFHFFYPGFVDKTTNLKVSRYRIQIIKIRV